MKKLVLGAFALVFGVFLLAGPSTAGAQAASSCFVFNNDLSVGMTFGEVLELQKFLAAEGSFTVELTGTFGPLTKSALAQYQSKNGIQATGYFGPQTRTSVNARCGQVLGEFAQASTVSASTEKLRLLEPRNSTTWQIEDIYPLSWYPSSNSANMDAFFEVKKGNTYEKVARLITNPSTAGSLTWGGVVDNTPDTLTDNSGSMAKPGKYFVSIVDRVTGKMVRTGSQVNVVKYGEVVNMKATAHPDTKTRVEAKDVGQTPVTIKDNSIVLSWSANADSCKVYAEVISELVPNETESYVTYDNEKRHITKKSFELPGNYDQYSVQIHCRKGPHTDVREFVVNVKGAQPYTTPVLDHVEDEDGNWRIVADQTAFLFGLYFNSSTRVYVDNDGDKYYFKTQLGKPGVIELLSIDLPAGTDNEFMLYAENGTKVSKPLLVEYRQPTQTTINVTSPDDGSVYDNGPDQNIGVSWEKYEGSFDYYRVGFHNHKAQVGGLISGPINKNSNGYSFKSKVVTDFVEDLSGKTWPKEGYQIVVYAIKVDAAGEGTVAEGMSGMFEIWHSDKSDISITEVYGFPNQQKGILTAGGSVRIYGDFEELNGDFSVLMEGKTHNASFEADKSFANALTANIPPELSSGRYDLFVQHGGSTSNRISVEVLGKAISCTFTRDLTLGSSGDDVASLQNILQNMGFMGTIGEDKGYFGAVTQAALAKFQASVGISPANGYFGPLVRAYIAANELCNQYSTNDLNASLVSKNSDVTGDNDSVGQFDFELDLTALNKDAYVGLSAGRGTSTPGQGFSLIVLDGNNNLVTTGKMTFSAEASADETANNRVRVEKNSTEKFNLTVFYQPALSGTYKVQLVAINYAPTDISPSKILYLDPQSTYRSNMQYINAIGITGARSASLTANTVAYSHIASIPNLSVGSTDPGVAAIQRYLNANGFPIGAAAGQPGSVGYESNTFGPATQRALAKFQASKGISPANGAFGPQTRAAMSQ